MMGRMMVSPRELRPFDVEAILGKRVPTSAFPGQGELSRLTRLVNLSLASMSEVLNLPLGPPHLPRQFQSCLEPASSFMATRLLRRCLAYHRHTPLTRDQHEDYPSRGALPRDRRGTTNDLAVPGTRDDGEGFRSRGRGRVCHQQG